MSKHGTGIEAAKILERNFLERNFYSSVCNVFVNDMFSSWILIDIVLYRSFSSLFKFCIAVWHGGV